MIENLSAVLLTNLQSAVGQIQSTIKSKVEAQAQAQTQEQIDACLSIANSVLHIYESLLS